MFSVIIPVYNGARFIDKAIESVKKQSYTHWEIIIINDGSTDDTQEVLKKYNDDSRISVYTQENRGVAAARNKGMEMAKHHFLTFLDADDIWRENHLEVIKKMIDKYPDAGLYATAAENHMVNGDVVIDDEFFKDKSDVVYMEDFFEAYAGDKSAKLFNMISTCVTKEAAQKAGGFPEGCKIGEDLEFSLVIAAYYPVVLSKEATTVYQKENSTATKDVSFDPDWRFFDTVKKLYSDMSIPESKKDNLKKVMQWFTIRRSRHYMIDNKRNRAVEVLKTVGKTDLKKDLFITKVLLMMPSALVRKIFLMRWRGQS